MENREWTPKKTARRSTTKTSNFVGDRLRLARSISGYTQKELAEIVAVTAPIISRLEASKREPSKDLLLSLCDALGVDPSFFAYQVVDECEIEQCSFRHLQSTPRRLLDQALAKGTLLHEAIARLAQIVVLPPPNVPSILAAAFDEIEHAAEETRNAWGLGLRAPITNAIRAAEHAGIVVTRLQGVSAKVDAFSRFGNPPMIVLASLKPSGSRDRFNVAHEIAHMVIHRGQPTGDIRTEREANRFAAAFLLPAAVFIEEFRFLRHYDWPHLFELKRRWKVAGSLILHRATELGLLDSITARRLYKQYSWKRWHHGEPYETTPEEPEIFHMALEIAERDAGVDLSTVAHDLGWRDAVTKAVTGLVVSSVAPPNVARLEDYRP